MSGYGAGHFEVQKREDSDEMDMPTDVSFEQLCRACMCKQEEDADSIIRDELLRFRSIYEVATTNAEPMRIAELLTSAIPQLLIQRNDRLPKAICPRCLEKLLNVYEFQRMCIRSDCNMRNVLGEPHSQIEDDVVVKKTEASEDEELLTANAIPYEANTVSDGASDPLQYTSTMSEVGNYLKLEINEKEDAVEKDLSDGMVKAEITNSMKFPQNTLLGCKNRIPTICDNNMEDGQSSKNNNNQEVESKMDLQEKKSFTSEIKNELDLEQKISDVKCDKAQFSTKDAVEKKIAPIRSKRCFFPPARLKCNEDEAPSASTVEANPEGYKCTDCPRRFAKQESLRSHQRSHSKIKNDLREFSCELCAVTFKTQLMLIKHKRNHKESKNNEELSNKVDVMKPYVCEYCNKAFQQSCTLKDHIRTHTGEQPFLCSECGKAFSSSSNMKQHLLRHTGEKRYECPECPKKFPCLSDLASHKAVHKKIKPHICDICGSAFGKPYQLKKHKMYHFGDKPHKCEYCEMRFVCADHVRRHMRTHTGEKPYKCKYCVRAFAQSNDLIKHLRSHLGENVYKCELCPKAFRLATELREHFAEHKNDDEETRQTNLKNLLEEEMKLRNNAEVNQQIKTVDVK